MYIYIHIYFGQPNCRKQLTSSVFFYLQGNIYSIVPLEIISRRLFYKCVLALIYSWMQVIKIWTKIGTFNWRSKNFVCCHISSDVNPTTNVEENNNDSDDQDNDNICCLVNKIINEDNSFDVDSIKEIDNDKTLNILGH